jgi:hypothetical protein
LISSSIVLCVALAVVAACGTTEEAAMESPRPQALRSPVVADDAATPATQESAKHRKRYATMAPIADPPKPPPRERVARADDAVPAGGASTSSGGGPSGGTPAPVESGVAQPSTPPAPAPSTSATTAAPAPTESARTPAAPATPSPAGETPGTTPVPTPSDTLSAVEPAPTVTAEATTPESDTTPGTQGLPLTLDGLRDMMMTPVGGFPLWMLIVAGILLAAGLVFGTGRRAKPKREEPTYEERTYEETSYEEPRYGDAQAEPKPA